MNEHEVALARIREFCLRLPETSERPSHGAPTFFVREKKSFVMFVDDHHGDGRLAIWCNALAGAQDFFIGADRTRFFKPPYVGVRGWLGVRLEGNVDWDQVAGIIDDAYRMAAPKRLVEAMEVPGNTPPV